MTALTAKHYVTGEQWHLTMVGGHLNSLDITPPKGTSSVWIAPLLVDLQVNGLKGTDFLDPQIDSEQIHQVARLIQRDGVSMALPTVTTQSEPRITAALRHLANARQTCPETASVFPGFHLEGPYLSAEDGPRGAHPIEHIRAPDWDEFCRFQEAANGCIRLLTLAPEYENSPHFIDRVCRSGVLVSIGHTAATGEQIRRAVDAGATLSTHLGNGAHGTLPRHPNYLWDQLADDRLRAMVIADGHHLPQDFLRSVARVKTADRLLAVSDITGMGGMPPGRYPDTSLGDVEVLETGKLVVAGQRQYLAGAARPLWTAIPHLLGSTSFTLPEIWKAVSRNPGRLVGSTPELVRHPSQLDALIFTWEPTPNTQDPMGSFRLLHVLKKGRDLLADSDRMAS
jgi:N-acetylglucosamine-6-phosphate deacetylase